MVFGYHNIHSVANKLDDLLEVRRDMSIDVMFLVETWHDTDSLGYLSASTCRRLSPVGTLTFTKRLDKVEIR